MSLIDTIKDDLKEAMNSQDKLKTHALRMVLSEFDYANIASPDSHDDTHAVRVLNSYYKRLLKSLQDYPEGDKKAEIDGEVKVIANYLPKGLPRR